MERESASAKGATFAGGGLSPFLLHQYAAPKGCFLPVVEWSVPVAEGHGTARGGEGLCWHGEGKGGKR